MNRTEHLLVCLAEECAEVTKEVTKILRFGMNDKPIQSLGGNELEPNSVRLQQEIIDVITLIDMIADEDDVLPLFNRPYNDEGNEFESMMAAKREKVEKYIKYAREKGTIQD